jgi:hypothetical protein
MADVAMEIWGKAAGGREAAAHLVFVSCVCVLSVCAIFTTSQRSFWRKKKHQVSSSRATTIESITRVNSLCKASNSLILMAINALIAICSIHLLPLAKF